MDKVLSLKSGFVVRFQKQRIFLDTVGKLCVGMFLICSGFHWKPIVAMEVASGGKGMGVLLVTAKHPWGVTGGAL
jgi:hypothetical protein